MADQLAALRSTIDKADSAYYRTGVAMMSDADYDALKVRLRELDPADERLTRVGPPYDAEDIGGKVTHRIPMGSLDNIDGGILGVADWYEDMYQKLRLTNGMAVMMSLKVDGSSIVLDYEDSKLVRASTRGNGTIGEDITVNAVLFQGVPTVLPKSAHPTGTFSVRGEAVLPKADFDQLMRGVPEESRSNARNVGNGIIGREDGTQSEYIVFYAFNLVNGADSEYDKYQELEALGFQVVPHQLAVSAAEMEEFYRNAHANRAGLPYHIDGLVAVLNLAAHQNKFVTADPRSRLRPKFARAIKFPAYTATTTVTGVVVTVGHNRVVVPTLGVRPVRIGAGITVDSVIVTNYDEIKRQDVAIGDEVEIFLAGDIIPNLLRVTQQSPTRRPILPPLSCPACGSPTTRESRSQAGANLYCTNLDCSAALIRKIGHWCGTSRKGIGILDIGDTMIQALWDAGIVRDPADLYTITPERIENVQMASGVRIGRSRAETIVNNIQAKRELPLHLFLGALGIDLLGTRRVTLLAEAAAGQLDTLEQWLDDTNLASLEIAGMTGANSITRAALRSGIDQCRPLIRKLLAAGVVVVQAGAAPAWAIAASATEGTGDASLTAPARPFEGKSFCFTGTRALMAETAAAGGVIKDGVSKGLTYLVQKSVTSESNKSKKARQYGTVVIDLDQLRAALNGEEELPR